MSNRFHYAIFKLDRVPILEVELDLTAKIARLGDTVEDRLVEVDLLGGYGSLSAVLRGVEEGANLEVSEVIVGNERNDRLDLCARNLVVDGAGLFENTVPAIG